MLFLITSSIWSSFGARNNQAIVNKTYSVWYSQCLNLVKAAASMKVSNFSWTKWSETIFWEYFSDQNEQKKKVKPDLLLLGRGARDFVNEYVDIFIHVRKRDLINNNIIFHWPGALLSSHDPSFLSAASRPHAGAWYQGFAGRPTWSIKSGICKIALEIK